MGGALVPLIYGAHYTCRLVFYANMSKCKFGMTELLYLGHVIRQEGLKVHQEKIEAILGWPSPRNITELRSFIGLCNYYR